MRIYIYKYMYLCLAVSLCSVWSRHAQQKRLRKLDLKALLNEERKLIFILLLNMSCQSLVTSFLRQIVAIELHNHTQYLGKLNIL